MQILTDTRTRYDRGVCLGSGLPDGFFHLFIERQGSFMVALLAVYLYPAREKQHIR